MNKEIFDIYTDFLLASFGKVSATMVAAMTEGRVSHDKITCFLRNEKFGSRELWKYVKPMVRKIETPDGIIIIDDSIAEKPYTDENDIVCWHWDHSKNRNVKGVNFVTALYLANDVSLPVGCELVEKKERYIGPKTGQERRRSARGKNEIFRDLLRQCRKNGLNFSLVLADIWYASAENMNYIKRELGKDFIMPLKSNRKVALSEKEKTQGQWVQLESVRIRKGEVLTMFLEGVGFPLYLVKQVFKNDDGSVGILHLVTSARGAAHDAITADYHKRWKVEEYHKSLKQNASLEGSPTKTVRTQTNHFFASICAFVKLEKMKLNSGMNHFAIKSKLYANVLSGSYNHLCGIAATCT
jgi:hypothetical protein